MVIVLKLDVGALDPAGTLEIYSVGTVDHDFSQGVVRQQGLDRAIAQNLGHDLLQEALAVSPAQDQVFLGEQRIVHLFNGLAHLFRLGHVDLGIQFGEQLAVNAAL